jgi:hypothetical protein
MLAKYIVVCFTAGGTGTMWFDTWILQWALAVLSSIHVRCSRIGALSPLVANRQRYSTNPTDFPAQCSQYFCVKNIFFGLAYGLFNDTISSPDISSDGRMISEKGTGRNVEGLLCRLWGN